MNWDTSIEDYTIAQNIVRHGEWYSTNTNTTPCMNVQLNCSQINYLQKLHLYLQSVCSPAHLFLGNHRCCIWKVPFLILLNFFVHWSKMNSVELLTNVLCNTVRHFSSIEELTKFRFQFLKIDVEGWPQLLSAL